VATDPSIVVAAQAGLLTSEVFVLGIYLQRRLADEVEAKARQSKITYLVDQHELSPARSNLKSFDDYVNSMGFSPLKRKRRSLLGKFLLTALMLLPIGLVIILYASLWIDAYRAESPQKMWIADMHLSVLGTASTFMGIVTILVAITAYAVLTILRSRIRQFLKLAREAVDGKWEYAD
jgi:hypothetical protein